MSSFYCLCFCNFIVVNTVSKEQYFALTNSVWLPRYFPFVIPCLKLRRSTFRLRLSCYALENGQCSGRLPQIACQVISKEISMVVPFSKPLPFTVYCTCFQIVIVSLLWRPILEIYLSELQSFQISQSFLVDLRCLVRNRLKLRSNWH